MRIDLKYAHNYFFPIFHWKCLVLTLFLSALSSTLVTKNYLVLNLKAIFFQDSSKVKKYKFKYCKAKRRLQDLSELNLDSSLKILRQQKQISDMEATTKTNNITGAVLLGDVRFSYINYFEFLISLLIFSFHYRKKPSNFHVELT